MRNLLKNEKVKYTLMAIGAITVLVGVIIGANLYLTSETYSLSLLGSGAADLEGEDGDIRTLVKKQVISSIDEGGFLTEDDIASVISDEMMERIIDDIKEKVDTAITNEVATAVDGATLTDADIKNIVDREVKNYIENNSSDFSEIEKLKAQIEALKKADDTLSSKIASSSSGKAGQAGATGKTGAQGAKGEQGATGKSAAEIMGLTDSQFKDQINTTTDNAKTAKSTAESAASTSKNAETTANTASKDVNNLSKTVKDNKTTGDAKDKELSDRIDTLENNQVITTDWEGNSVTITINK